MKTMVKNAVFDLLLGAMLALALPPLDFWPVIFVSLPLFIARLEARKPFLAGWLFGFGYFCVALHWIGFAFLVDAETYLWMMPFAVGGLAGFLALYWGLAAISAQWMARRFGLPLWALFPGALAVAELLRGRLFTGFAWAAPGLAADGMGGVLQLASLVGMTGLTFLLLLWGAAILPLVKREARMLPIACIALLPLSWAYGEWRMAQTPTKIVEGVKVRLVQPNVAQDDKWSLDNAGPIFTSLLEQSTLGSPATHIIWPESAVPFLIDESPGAKEKLDAALDDGQILLTGAIRRNAPNAGADHFTSILAFNGKGEVTAHYDKWRLVPGGEFLPLEWLLEPLGFKKLVTLPGGFRAGPGPALLNIKGLGRAGMLICYEVIFPHGLVPSTGRPDLLLNVTNDGWFGNSTGPHQHLAQARMRAVEQGLPLLRAANTGISASIDPLGRTIAKSRLGEKTVLNAGLSYAIGAPLYSRIGDVALFLILSMLIAFLRPFSRLNRGRI